MKSKLLDLISERLKADLKVAIDAAVATYEAATHEESKPENEYDTRALEASYLAGAQAKRVGELEELISICNQLSRDDLPKGSPVQAGALVELDLEGQAKTVFVLPKGGGMTFKVDERSVQIVTPVSPLGRAIVRLKEGEVTQVEVGGSARECEIISVR